MKELTPHTQTQQHEERQQEQHYRILGRQLHRPGHTLFEYNFTTKQILPAEITPNKTAVAIPVGQAPQKRYDKSEGLLNQEYFIQKHSEEKDRSIGQVLYKQDCFYFEALNQKSASRKVAKLIQRGEI